MKENEKKVAVAFIIVAALVAFFFLAKQASPEYFRELGLVLPLPLFTLLIAIIDGFNPCTMWVLTFLLVLLLSVSHSRKRILAVGYTFVGVVFIVYFLFMAAWLNVFLYLGYIDTVRIAIALVALAAGVINCKDYFFFRKGVTLMIQEKHKGPLVKRIETMKDVIRKGSMPALIIASITLALFASLVELPCTAGWPIIYTNILTGKALTNIAYYVYLLFYNLIYIIPLAAIITVFGYFFKGKQITKEQMQVIKLIGGLIMIALGIILLVNPELLMLV
jgi:cytochrome c biogenesis protein CcdA